MRDETEATTAEMETLKADLQDKDTIIDQLRGELTIPLHTVFVNL